MMSSCRPWPAQPSRRGAPDPMRWSWRGWWNACCAAARPSTRRRCACWRAGGQVTRRPLLPGCRCQRGWSAAARRHSALMACAHAQHAACGLQHAAMHALARIGVRSTRRSMTAPPASLPQHCSCPCAPPPPTPHPPPAAQVWHLRVDVHVLDHGGNLTDACCLAALAALRAFRKPEAAVDPATGDVMVYSPDVREPQPLTIHHLPFCFTFGLFEVRAGHWRGGGLFEVHAGSAPSREGEWRCKPGNRAVAEALLRGGGGGSHCQDTCRRASLGLRCLVCGRHLAFLFLRPDRKRLVASDSRHPAQATFPATSHGSPATPQLAPACRPTASAVLLPAAPARLATCWSWTPH